MGSTKKVVDSNLETNLSGPYCVGSEGRNTNRYLKEILISFCIGFLTWPTAYGLDVILSDVEPRARTLWLALSRVAVLSMVFGIALKSIRSQEWMSVGWSVLGFLSNIAFMLTLENDGVITGYMYYYGKFGDELLSLQSGFSLAILDGFLYLVLVYVLSSGKGAVSTVIFWLTAVVTNIVGILVGNYLGKLDTALLVILHGPYMMVPLSIIYRVFMRSSGGGGTGKKRQ